MPQQNNKPLLLIILAVVAVVIALAAFLGRRSSPAAPASDANTFDSGRFMVMGTFGQIRLRCPDRETGEKAVAAAKAALAHVDSLMNIYRHDSELSKVNRGAATDPVEVSRETFDLLTKAAEYSRLSDGAFDITVPPLLQLWKRAAQNNEKLAPQDLTAALKLVGYANVDLIEHEDGRLLVRFAQPGMSLDTGAIAKGYGVDRALAAVRIPGVAAALVEIGGEIACFGDGHRQGGWLVGVQDPFAPDTDNQLSQSARQVLRLRDAAVATSGNYRRYVTVAGERMSHIVDPRTGRPAAVLPSVTIIAPTATDADALATIVSVIGPDKGLKLIESLDDIELLAIAGNAAQFWEARSTGFNQYMVQP